MHEIDLDQIPAYVERIRAAYRQLAAPGRWVSLADLRPQVGGYRPLVSAGLLALSMAPDVRMAAAGEPGDHDRDSAVTVERQDMHLIAIG